MSISERRDELVKEARTQIECVTSGDTVEAHVAALAWATAELCGFLAALELRDPEPTETPDAK